MNERMTQALLLIKEKRVIPDGENKFLADGHAVTEIGSGFRCDCTDSEVHGSECCHIKAVTEMLRKDMMPGCRFILYEKSEITACTRCSSGKIKKNGWEKNNGGKVQIYWCHECKKKFYGNVGFKKMRTSPEIIMKAVYLYCTSMSSREVRAYLRSEYGISVSHKAVLDWVGKYSKMLSEYIDGITPRLSDIFRADEVYTWVNGSRHYMFGCIDDGSRYWISHDMAPRKAGHDADRLLEKALAHAGKAPESFITDGLPSYLKSSERVFGKGTKHIRHIHMDGKRDTDNNNKMERFNGWFRSREREFRGLKRPDTPIIPMLRIYYNFVREHSGIDGTTPSEAAGIIIKGKKLMTLVQNAALYMAQISCP